MKTEEYGYCNILYIGWPASSVQNPFGGDWVVDYPVFNIEDYHIPKS